MNIFKTNLGRFRIIAFLEGLSFILLMGVAMPLKYYAGMTEATRDVGMIHGLLFVAYVFMLIPIKQDLKLNSKTTGLLFLASILPFGTFIAEFKLLRKAA